MWKILWNVITGNLAGIVSAVTGIVGKLSDNETAKLQTAIGADKEVAIAQMQANAQAYQTRSDLLKGSKLTQWLLAGALLPPLFHSGGVYLDSCPFFLIPYFPHVIGSWNFVALPAPYDQYEWLLISSLLGINTGLTVGMGLAKTLILRK